MDRRVRGKTDVGSSRFSEMISIEESRNLFDYLVASRIGASPFHCLSGSPHHHFQRCGRAEPTRGMKTIHDRIKLQTRSRLSTPPSSASSLLPQKKTHINVRPNPSNLRRLIENNDFESMRNQMRRRGDSSDSSSDDGYSTSWSDSRSERDVRLSTRERGDRHFS